jgi:hypothetical protein
MGTSPGQPETREAGRIRHRRWVPYKPQFNKEARDIVASQQARKSPSKPRDVETLVSQIWDDVRQLKLQAKNPPHAGTSLTRSWASVAASGTTLCSTSPSFGPAQVVKPTAQRLREVKIKFTDSMERSGLLGMTNKAILYGINRHFLTSQAAGVKRLPSGNMVIQTASEEDRKSLIANQKWLTSLGSTGAVLTERFPVFVHAVCVANIDPE